MDDMLGKVRDWMKPWMKGTSPLEIRRAVLDEAESKVIAVGEGKRIYPFDHLRIHLLATDPQERAGLEAAARHGWDLKNEIAGRLAERGCPVPPHFEVEIVFDEPRPEFGERRFFIEYEARQTPPPPSGIPATAEAASPSVRPVLELTVLKGNATQHVYDFEGLPRIHLGRLEEVMDPDGRVRRRNDVAFREEGEVNTTVSREHARITWDDAGGGYWLRAEQNASGTRIYRAGRTIDVSAHDRRGVRIQAGDEIYLGRACVKVGMR
ncbi:MAG TPA: FHA domain-containing protein [Thermoanaerobaculia bacterium]|nr:FHA domain-containing protein [Thermoanaerobaculia bacterium]